MEADGFTYDQDFPHALEKGFELFACKDGWLKITDLDYRRGHKIGKGFRVYIYAGGKIFVTSSFTAWKFRFRPTVEAAL